MEWVTKLSRCVLAQRKLTKDTERPDDIQKLQTHVLRAIENTDLKDNSLKNYKCIASPLQTRLLCYNKRRSGEIDAIT